MVSFAGGAALFTALIVYEGVGEVTSALALAGRGLCVVALLHVLPLLASAAGWFCIVRSTADVRFRTLLAGRWIAEAINQLLPVMQIGGNVVRARMLAERGTGAAAAAASVVVDVTLHVLGQIVFTVLGLWLWLAHTGLGEAEARALLGLIMMGLAVFGFYAVQRRGLFRAMAMVLDRIAGAAEWRSVVASAAAMDLAVARLYRERRAVLTASGWHLASWVLGTGETWLALRFFGQPVSLPAAFVLESVCEAIKTAAFIVPGALGVQEGGYLVLGTMLGFGPEVALSASLAKRIRELIWGVPGLIAWQIERSAAAFVAPAGESHRGGG